MRPNHWSNDEKKVERPVTDSHAVDYALAVMAIVLALVFAYGSKINDGATSLAALVDCINQLKTSSTAPLFRCTQENMGTHIVRVQSAYSVGRNVIGASALTAVLLALLNLWIGRIHIVFRVAALVVIGAILFYQLGTTV